MTGRGDRAGFIGLGAMGAPIARRLARSGFAVTGYDISPEALAAFDEAGTGRCDDPLETARRSDLLGICVRTDGQLESLVDGGRLFAELGEGGLVILHSTVAPDLARRMAALAAEHGVGFVDVGVSGGGPAAIEGQLSLFVGGEDADVERARPWLEAIGKSLAHLGPVGRGLEGKLLNNLISIANYGMSAAIVDVADALGFDRTQLLDALMAGSAQSFALRIAPGFITPRAGRDTPDAFMDLHDLLAKDVEHCRELPASDPAQMAALLASCEAMLARLRRAAGQETPRPSPEAVTERYFAAIRARDLDAFVALFAQDAVYTMPNGTRLTGHAEIREAQAKVFTHGKPDPHPQGAIVGPDGIAVEIDAHLPDGSVRHTVNVYRLDEAGLIRTLSVYMRG